MDSELLGVIRFLSFFKSDFLNDINYDIMVFLFYGFFLNNFLGWIW
jgi:hypothetical protein